MTELKLWLDILKELPQNEADILIAEHKAAHQNLNNLEVTNLNHKLDALLFHLESLRSSLIGIQYRLYVQSDPIQDSSLSFLD